MDCVDDLNSRDVKDLEAQPKPGPWNPTNYELWVERGVIWDLKRSWLLGFTDYSSIEPYFGPTPFGSYKSVLAGSPFSMQDFPVYGYAQGAAGYLVYSAYYIFSAVNMLSYMSNVWKYFINGGLSRDFATDTGGSSGWIVTTNWKTPPAGSGPLVSRTHLSSFIARTPTGSGTFSAKYLAYVPPSKYWSVSGMTWPVWDLP